MEEDLDLEYINNYGIDEFNAALILDPAEVPNNKYLGLMELEHSGLPMLCPLAKALYYLGRPEFRVQADRALRNIRIIDPSRSINRTSESVHHVIKKISCGLEVCLEFRSHSDFIWASGQDEPDDVEMQVGTFAHCKFSEQVTQDSLIEEVFLIAGGDVSSPMGEPVDDGPFVCSLSYRLYTINGLPLKHMPVIEHSTHYLDFVVSDIEGPVTWPEYGDEEFEWIDLLSKSDREMIFRHIPLLASQLEEESSATRGLKVLTVDEIQRSYSTGDVKKVSPSKLKVVIGCGTGWHPELENNDDDDDDDEGHDLGEGDISFPTNHPPLLEISLPLESQSQRNELDQAFPALKLFIDAALALE